MSTPASRAPRLRLALQPLIVKLYKVAGIFALGVILVGLVAYVVVNIFYFFNDSWVKPVILSPRHERVVQATTELAAAEERLAALELERARTTAELARIARLIAANQAFDHDMAPVVAASGKTLAAVTARRELDRAMLERQAALDDKATAEQYAHVLDKRLAEQKAAIERLGASFYLKGRAGQVVVGFVPYDNLPDARPGTTLYRCKWGLLRCSSVGKVVSVLEGEVTEHHLYNGAVKRGVMIEIQLHDASAGQDNVLFAGSRPFWLF
jgi:hypothetical protein